MEELTDKEVLTMLEDLDRDLRHIIWEYVVGSGLETQLGYRPDPDLSRDSARKRNGLHPDAIKQNAGYTGLMDGVRHNLLRVEQEIKLIRKED